MNSNLLVSVGALALVSFSCTSNTLSSDEAAEAAYLGLDGAIRKSLVLGFDGFNAASSANIPEQMTTGDATGTLVVSGQVDQGASSNKGMRLLLELVDYRDALESPDPEVDISQITYSTAADAPPMFTLSLRGIPDATLSGTLVGTFSMTGEVEGEVTLDVAITGMTEEDPNDATRIRRVTGSTTVTGTATSEFGVFDVSTTL